MKARYVRRLGIMGILVVGVFLAFNVMSKPEASNPNNVLNLQPPPFLNNTAFAAPNAQAGTSFLEDEAGISAYTQTSSGSIDLSQVRNAFRTIEYETSDYLIGSVALTDYQEVHDVHVYVNSSGWVVAYYRAENPASKIIDLLHYDGVTISTTKLEMAMEKVLVEIGVVSFTTTYYDFRYPNATKLMLIAERHDGTDNRDFELQIPDTFVMYERSWALCDREERCCPSTTTLYLDGVQISSFDANNHSRYGVLTPAQLSPATYHNFSISTTWGSASTAGVALVYNEGN